MNQCALPASSLGVVTGSRLKGKLTLTSRHSPAHQTRFSSQTPTETIIADRRLFVDEARDASFALTGYLGLLFSFPKFLWELSFLVIYKLNSFPHTSKYKNQGMFIIRGAMLTVCPTKKDRTKVNDSIMRSKLGLSVGRAVVSALAPEQHKKGYVSSRHSAGHSEPQVTECCLTVKVSRNPGARVQTYNAMLPQILSPTNLSPPIPCQLCSLLKFRFPKSNTLSPQDLSIHEV